VHPENGMAYTYPLHGHVDVDFRLDDDAVIEAAQQLATRISEHSWWTRRAAAPPPGCGGPAYQWREAGVDVDNVLNVVCATQLQRPSAHALDWGHCCEPICAGSILRLPTQPCSSSKGTVSVPSSDSGRARNAQQVQTAANLI
jgi:hypothetical protein